MCELITHRGPDDEGHFFGPGINMGMRRLSIIDLRTGHQPISNEDETVWVVFNGEIYNFLELREALEANGHRFRTQTDTEVLVHLYEEEGLDFPHKLNGMFAIAIWDSREQRLVLIRDRMGIKPLYYALPGRELVFASEIKSILLHPDVEKKLNPEAIHHYLSFKNVPAPFTSFQGIFALEPGHMAVFQDGRLEAFQYWQLTYGERYDYDESYIVHRIGELLDDSIRMRLVSDVPVGAYLSGGLDSSFVVALMSQHYHKPIKTFSLVYEDDFPGKTSDRHFAKLISKRFGTEHHEYFLKAQEVPETIFEIVESFDEPFSGVISTFFLSQLVKQYVKVCLSGDGADELFGSYKAHRLAQPIHHFLTFRDQIEHDPNFWSDHPELFSPYANELDTLSALAEPEEWRWRVKLLAFKEEEKRQLYAPLFGEILNGIDSGSLIRTAFEEATAKDALNRVLEVDCRTLLPDQVLAFVDKLSMAHSIEIRPPFLDYRLVEFVATIPGPLKIKDGIVKYILKETARGTLPDDLIDRPKEGFIMPLNAWLLTQLKPFVYDTLQPKRLAQHEFFEPEAVAKLIDEHFAHRADNSSKLWTLMMFQLWYESYFG